MPFVADPDVAEKQKGRFVPDESTSPSMSPARAGLEAIEPTYHGPNKSVDTSPTDLTSRISENNPAFGSWLKGDTSIAEQVLSIPDKVGSKVATTTAGLGLHPEAAAALGVGVNLGINAIPIMRGGQAAKAAAPVVRKASEWLMGRAINPTVKDMLNGDAARAIDTMLEESVNVTKGGMAKLQQKIDVLNKQLNDVIDNAKGNINIRKAAQPFIDKLREFRNQINDEKDVAAAKDVWRQFKEKIGGASEIPIQNAQKLKQGTYKRLSSAYDQEIPTAAKQSQQAVTRGLKTEIENIEPKVIPINKDMEKLINALDVSERKAMQELVKDPAGLAVLANDPRAAAAYMVNKSSLFQSILANMLNAGKESIPAGAARLGISGAEGVNQSIQGRKQ